MVSLVPNEHLVSGFPLRVGRPAVSQTRHVQARQFQKRWCRLVLRTKLLNRKSIAACGRERLTIPEPQVTTTEQPCPANVAGILSLIVHGEQPLSDWLVGTPRGSPARMKRW